ncbi:MAG: hypothetical protein ACOYXT_13625 [Bacteroidota bacterium]
MKTLKVILIISFALLGFDRVAASDPVCATGTCSVTGGGTYCVGESVHISTGCSSANYSHFDWDDGNGNRFQSRSFNTTYYSPGTYTITLTAMCDEDEGCGAPKTSTGSTTVTIVAPPAIPIISGPSMPLCNSGTVSLSISNPVGTTYTWFANGSTIGTGTSINYSFNGTTTSIKVEAGTGCKVESNVFTISMLKTEITPVLLSSIYRKTDIQAYGSGYAATHFWQTGPNDTDTAFPATSPYTVTESCSIYVRNYKSDINCWATATGPLAININQVPPLAEINQVAGPGQLKVFFINEPKDHILRFADYYWVDNATDNPTIVAPFIQSQSVIGDKLFQSKTYYLKGRDRATGTWGPTLTLSVSINFNDDWLNWIHAKQFDGTNQSTTPVIYAQSKAYFDYAGKPLQSQTKNHTRDQVFATQNLKDSYERLAGATLPAPIASGTFRYTPGFFLNANQQPYSFKDFDLPGTTTNPNRVDNSVPGTLGWYYGEHNTLQPHTPNTGYPYSRKQFYEDGSEEVKRSASPGDQHRMGNDHDILTGSFPVFNELKDYAETRHRLIFPGIVQSEDLTNRGVQTIARDQNGKYSISIADRSGKTVMTARQGDANNKVLTVSNTVAINADRPMLYFYLLNAQVVIISGTGTYVVQDMATGNAFTPVPNAPWPAGLYRILYSTGDVTVTYENHFMDVAYQFYDDAGRIKASLSPNGFSQLKATSGDFYEKDVLDPNKLNLDAPKFDAIVYKYNQRGWLLSMAEPDAGRTEYVYRKDGRIRFSQNSDQRTTGDRRFSYTNYDALGRPVESGEYLMNIGSSNGTTFKSQKMNGILENTSGNGGLTDGQFISWNKTHYDVLSPEFESETGLGDEYQQTFVRNAVSWTENANIQTWYSYDERGRVTWMAQKPLRIGKVFVTTYTYDFLGNVLEVYTAMYTGGNVTSKFYHHYTYDADKRLSEVFTSTDGTNKKLRAKYEYYMHGPLKRIELGENVQGVDFVYNIQGWLTQINHPDKDPTKDPGGDSNDAFGMLLDYYESNIAPGLVTPMALNDPLKFHGLSNENHYAQAMHQPLVRFQIDETTANSMFKSYSAENPMYKQLIQQATSNDK